MRVTRAIIVGCGLLLAACGDGGLRELNNNNPGPDEFRVLPGKPLEQPKDYASLPPPTPGGSNRTDQDPIGDAVVALGGSRKATKDNGIPSGDGGLVNYASRMGRSADIRQVLWAEDEEFRRKRSRFANIRIVKEDRYNEVYKASALDAYAESARWRRAGVKTPAAPPGGG